MKSKVLFLICTKATFYHSDIVKGPLNDSSYIQFNTATHVMQMKTLLKKPKVILNSTQLSCLKMLKLVARLFYTIITDLTKVLMLISMWFLNYITNCQLSRIANLPGSNMHIPRKLGSVDYAILKLKKKKNLQAQCTILVLKKLFQNSVKFMQICTLIQLSSVTM